MSILGMCGAEAQRTEDDGVIVIDGPPGYQTIVPVGSASSRSFSLNQAKFEIPWVSGEVAGATRREPSGTEYWFGFNVRPNANNTSNNLWHFGVGRSGSEIVTVSYENTTARVTIRLGGSVVATSSSFAFSPPDWTRIHVHVDNQNGGFIKVYAEGDLTTPVVQYALTAAHSNPNAFYVSSKYINSNLIDDLWAMDPLDATGLVDVNQLANASVQAIPFTGNGFYTDWTGSYTDIDEIPASDSDYINADAVDEASTFTHGSTSEDAVHFVQTRWRMTRTGTDAGEQVQIRVREGTTDKDETITTAPGSGNVVQQHHTAADGTAWDKAHLTASQFGPVSRT